MRKRKPLARALRRTPFHLPPTDRSRRNIEQRADQWRSVICINDVLRNKNTCRTIHVSRSIKGMFRVSRELLEACNQARRDGADFPSIWWQIQEPHPLVLGIPTQTMDNDGPALDICLQTGQRLRFGREHFILA